MTDEVRCPLCSRIVLLVSAGAERRYERHWQWERPGALGPPCGAGGKTPADARELLRFKHITTGLLRRQVEARIAREQMDWHAALSAACMELVRRHALSRAPMPARPWDVGRLDALFGIPLVIDANLPAGEWRIVANADGQVLWRGMWDDGEPWVWRPRARPLTGVPPPGLPLPRIVDTGGS